jgi:uncharacterized protein (UPF0332 family)
MPGARQRRIHRARETLRDAHLLLDQEGSPESVINRSYYAMFYAVLALLTRQIGDYRELYQLDREQA